MVKITFKIDCQDKSQLFIKSRNYISRSTQQRKKEEFIQRTLPEMCQISVATDVRTQLN